MLRENKKPYSPKEVESEIYQLWEKSGYFNPDRLPPISAEPRRITRGTTRKIQRKSASSPRKSAFCIIMPPPNANAPLHLGHAVFVGLQDIMIRYHRMKGEKTLWLPGADHAGFETQVVFDKKLEREGRNRFDIPREKLYQEMLKFTLANKQTMENQLRQLGSSCDWSREKFTLDDDIVKIVYQTFEKLYQDGLVYRGERIVNWCVKHQTSLSELETKYIEKKDPLYYIKYGSLVVATVRPETKFGDTALAVNPKDKRYENYIGKEIEIETLLGPRKIKVIADEMVDMDFGTGAVKVTPAHDPQDFEIGQKHNLEIREVIDKFGRLNEKTGPYQGLKVNEARKKVAEDLKTKGLLAKVDENYLHSVAVCYKCSTIIEPRIMKQWFVRVAAKPQAEIRNPKSEIRNNKRKSLRDLAVEAVKSGKVKFITKRYKKIFFHWMKNIRDWNISRQIVWGIPIPVKYCDECEGVVVDVNDKIASCPKCGEKSASWRKETDTFDTWFSSGQWPFATLLTSGRSKSKVKSQKSKISRTTKDFEEFYPTSVMETGWDILFFWVARMLMLGIYATGKPPFKQVYLHGLVRDKDRQKMSKSKGNVIDPLGVIEMYGADALRMALIVGNTPGSDIIISEEKIRGYQRFANKVWNAARFVIQNGNFQFPISNLPANRPEPQGDWQAGFQTNPKSQAPNSKPRRTLRQAQCLRGRQIQNLTSKDKKILRELENLTKEITKLMDSFKFYAAAEKIYHYFWHEFADKIIEQAKPRLKSEDEKEREVAQYILTEILETMLKLLHPFMPFVTEKIWQEMEHKNLLIIEKWPRS